MSQPSVLSNRALELRPSLTLEISSKAQQLKKEGKNICSLSAGEPDFETPGFIVEAAVKALQDGWTRYGPAAGDPELRDAIATKQTERNKVPTEIENVLITNGGKQAIYNISQILLNPGDEVLIPSPYWLSYPQIVSLAGAKPISVESSNSKDFKINIEKLESKVTNKTKLLIINSPSNPTGHVMSLDEIREIADFLRRHPQILLITDEIYEFLLAKHQIHYSFSSIAPDLLDRVFTVNGFAKGWAMTGWRIGYLTGPKEIIKKAIALQSQSTSNVCSFAQRGALAALKGSRECIDVMVESYNVRREILVKGLRGINGLELVSPKGAFYAFPRLTGGDTNSISFCKRALEEVGLAMVPGAAFGAERYIRLSCASSTQDINDGITRLKQLLI